MTSEGRGPSRRQVTGEGESKGSGASPAADNSAGSDALSAAGGQRGPGASPQAAGTRETKTSPADPRDSWLLLENQLCFPFYAVSRLITRAYQPLLDPLGLTYPQYLVMLALWEADGVPIQTISDRLLLNTNTLTPLLKRLESSGLITRRRDGPDERVVKIRLTDEGRALKEEARRVPEALVGRLIGDGAATDTDGDSPDFSPEELLDLRETVKRFLRMLESRRPE